MEKMKASLNAEVPADQPNVANVMAIVAPGQDKHRVLAMGSSRTFGLDAAKQETSYGLPYEPVNLGAGSVYKIFTTATALQKAWASTTRSAVAVGYASIYVDGNGRPIPVANSGELPGAAVDHGRAGPVAELRSSSSRSSRRPGRRRHGVRLDSRWRHPFVDPNTDGARTGPSPGSPGQKQASFTLEVSPTSVLELSNVGAACASGGKWCPPSRSGGHRRERPAGDGHRGAVRPGGRAGPGEHC